MQEENLRTRDIWETLLREGPPDSGWYGGGGNRNIGTYTTREAAQFAAQTYSQSGAIVPGIGRRTVAVCCKDPVTDTVSAFGSVKEAAACIGCSAHFVTMVCNNTYKGRRRLAKGWKCWYAEEAEYD